MLKHPMIPAMLVAMVAVTAEPLHAQVAPPNPDDTGTAHPMMKAAGMPLRDGTLPPGMLTVRIVRGGFTNNVADQPVQLEVSGGRVETSRTGPDGRAQFAHLPIGGTVRAATLLDGERLASDSFEMPAESGIRLLLIGGEGAAVASGVATQLPSPGPVSAIGAPAAPEAVAAGPAAPRDPEAGVGVLRAIMAGATLLAFGLFFSQRRPRARSRAGHDPSEQG